MTKPQYTPMPKLLGTFAYTDLIMNATKFKVFSGVLNRKAKQRTITFNNTTDVSILSPYFNPIDSVVGVVNGYGTGLQVWGGIGPNTSQISETSEHFSLLSAHVDGCIIGLPIGSVAPTKGAIYIYIEEIF